MQNEFIQADNVQPAQQFPNSPVSAPTAPVPPEGHRPTAYQPQFYTPTAPQQPVYQQPVQPAYGQMPQQNVYVPRPCPPPVTPAYGYQTPAPQHVPAQQPPQNVYAPRPCPPPAAPAYGYPPPVPPQPTYVQQPQQPVNTNLPPQPLPAYAPGQPVTQWVYIPVWNPTAPVVGPFPQPVVYQPMIKRPPTPQEIAREKQRKFVRDVRGRSNKASGFSLIYIGIISELVMLALFLFGYFELSLSDFKLGNFREIFERFATEDNVAGVGYMLATMVAVFVVFLWKKKRFFRNVLFSRNKKMKASTLFIFILMMFGVQAIALINASFLELILNQLGDSGFSITEAPQAETPIMMLLYTGILAPISEEIMFRGGVMRTLQPAGKRFAILASGVLFAVMHCNMFQIPFAFVAGLILGYVTVEYSLWWSIFLHTFNNLILAEGVGFITRHMPQTAGLVFQIGLIAIGTIGAVVVCIVKRRDIAAYLRSERMAKGSIKGFLSSPFTIIMLVYAATTSGLTMFF